MSCPGNFFSSASSSGCFSCLKGFYYSNKGTCEACPVGTVCKSNGGASQLNLTIAEGYWRISPLSVDVIECPLPGGCAGASIFSQLGDGYCAVGYTGPLCAVTLADFTFIFLSLLNVTRSVLRFVILVYTTGAPTQRSVSFAKMALRS